MHRSIVIAGAATALASCGQSSETASNNPAANAAAAEAPKPAYCFFKDSETKGWKATLDRYQKRYQADGKEMGKLTFSDFHAEVLAPNAAVVRGKFELVFEKEKDDKKKKAAGRFTLILKKFPDGWKVVHDHTSAEEVVVDLGFNMPNPNPQGQSPQLLFKVTERVIMSYSSIKRLSTSLSQLIKRYEQQFGEIPTQPGQKRP